MDLRQLRYFIAVSRLGSVTRAAEQCHVAQPAISIAIRNLEDELGVQLFERSHKKVSLTSTGQVFLSRAEDIVERVAYSIKEMDDYSKLERGVIRLGITPMLGAILFPYVLSRFRVDHPQLELLVVEEGALSVKDLLERGELDVGILAVEQKWPKLEVTPLVRCEMFACLSPEHPLAGRERIALSRLRDEPFILFKEDTISRRIILDECARYGISPKIVFSSNQIATIASLVERGVGVGFLFESLLRDNPRIVSRHLARPLHLQAGLVWNRERYLSNASQAFIAAIRSYSFDGIASA